MNLLLHRIKKYAGFYWSAKTKYQIHSPFVFELVNAVLEDDRYYYAFRDIEKRRADMVANEKEIEVIDFGAGSGEAIGAAPGVRMKTKTSTVSRVARLAGSSLTQSHRLFRLVHFCKPESLLELGSSVGIGSMYIGSAAQNSKFLTLEGCPNCADIAQSNLSALGLRNAEVISGAFENTLLPSLERLKKVDFVFFDGNHRYDPTVRYFETCLEFAHEHSVFVLDDIFWSEGMTEAWEYIKNHPKVTLTVSFSDISMAFFNPDFKVKQHYNVVPYRQKPWMIY